MPNLSPVLPRNVIRPPLVLLARVLIAQIFALYTFEILSDTVCWQSESFKYFRFQCFGDGLSQ